MSLADIMRLAGDTDFAGGADPGAELVEEIRPVSIRGEAIPVKWRVRRMPDGSEFLLESDGPDPVLLAREEYRRRRGWPSGQSIAEWRTHLPGGVTLSQAELAAVLGFGIATLKRYEGGALPTEAHARVIGDAKSGGLARMAQTAGDAVSKAKLDALVGYAERSSVLHPLAARLSRRPADIFSGNRSFDLTRFKSVVQHLLARPAPKTTLNKRLFYVDFRMFRDFGVSLTGLRYARLPRGPVPDDYDALFGLLVGEGTIAIEEVTHGNGIVEERISSVVTTTGAALETMEMSVSTGCDDRLRRIDGNCIERLVTPRDGLAGNTPCQDNLLRTCSPPEAGDPKPCSFG